MRKLILVCSVLLFGSLAFAGNIQTCGQMTNPVPYEYCITKTEGSANMSVLYFLHGGGGDHTSWGPFGSEIYYRWAYRGVDAPVVVSVSFGPYWLLVEPNASPNSGLLNAFQSVVIPQMENLALGQPALERSLLGMSMGGFNTVQLLAKSPVKTFARASMVCPAIVDLNPYATEQQVIDYATKHNNDPAEYENLAFIAQAFISDASIWDNLDNPMILTDKVVASQTELMIAFNTGDKTFGPDGMNFATKVAATKGDLVMSAWDGGHCDLDMDAIADFLIPVK